MSSAWLFGNHTFRMSCEDALGRPACARIAASDGLCAERTAIVATTSEPPKLTPRESLHQYRLKVENEWRKGILAAREDKLKLLPEPAPLEELRGFALLRAVVPILEAKSPHLVKERPSLTVIEGGRDAR